jgi:hemoglobin
LIIIAHINKMKTDITSTADIEIFVNRFYDLLAIDDMLKPIFFDRLGHGDWSVHLKRIVDFWDTVLFATATYKGQSFLPHASMNLTQIHFDQWLALFNQSIDENFEGEKASEAKQRANTMAILFMSKINYYRENGGTPLM